jgi:hypothetical protein
MIGTHVPHLGQAGRIVALLTAVLSALLATAVSASASTAVAPGVPISSLSAPARAVLPSTVPADATPAAKPPTTSNFAFCNDTGGRIACFNAKLTFLSRYEFEIYSVYLADTLCDARSVAATVLSQNTIWSQGYLGGLPYFYKNSMGCGHTEQMPNYIFEARSAVQYVYITLWAGNNNGHSSVVSSLKHYNPFY